MDSIPKNTTSSEFNVYRHSKINVLSNHFFASQKKNHDIFIEDWENFKFDLMSVRKKMCQSERKLVKKWALKQICTIINCEICPIINLFTKIAYIIPVSNPWPERGGSVKNILKQAKEIF